MSMKGKRILALLLVFGIVMALVACTPDDQTDASTGSTDPASDGTSLDAAGNSSVEDVSDEKGSGTTNDISQDITTGSDGTDTTVPKAANGATVSNTTAPKPETNPMKMGKEALLAYYNKAANDAKANAKSITKTESLVSQAGDPKLSNWALNGLANLLLPMFLKDGWSKVKDGTYTTKAEIKAGFPVSGQNYASKLTASDIESVSCAKSGSNDIVTVKVKGASVAKACNIVSAQVVRDSAEGYATFNDIKIDYPVSTITATISASGKLQQIEYYYPNVQMYFDVKGFGTATMAVTLGDRFSIAW